MGRARELLARLLASWRRRQMDAEFDEELAAHLEMSVEDNVRAGLTLEEARRRALIRLGGVEPTRETHREARGLPNLESILRDVRVGGRSLRRSPGFTAVVVTVLALAIGGNSAVFGLVHAVLVRPLPFQEPDRLVVLWEEFSATGARGRLSRAEPAPANYVAWRSRSRSWAELAALEVGVYNLTGDGHPAKLVGVRVTPNLPSLLGLTPVVGRLLSPSDEEPRSDRVVVLSERFWRQRYAADPALVGRSILLNDLPHTVVGVLPDAFRFPDAAAAFWVPAAFSPQELASHGAHWSVVGRLRPGIALAEARAEMATIARQLEAEHPRSNVGIGVALVPLHEELAGDARPALLVLMGAMALVLLVACANLANLLLARGASRLQELAVRRALGAAPARVVRQVLTETLVLASLGVMLGVAACTASFRYLARLVPKSFPEGMHPGLDITVLSFTAGATLLTLLIFGAGPALAAARVDPGEALRKGTGRATPAVGRRFRHALVVGEVTLTVVLLVGAGLLVRSYARVLRVDPGFEPRNLLVAETVLSPSRYSERAARSAFHREVLSRVHALPGVVAAGYVNYPPITLKDGRGYVSIEGRPAPPLERRALQVVSWRVVSPRYLSALGVPVVRGRHLDERDGPDAPGAVVVNQAMARLHWPDGDAIGQRLKLGQAAASSSWCTIVGVVGDVRQMGLEVAPEPEVYFPLDQPTGAAPFFWPQHLVVRTHGDPLALVPALRRAIWDVDAGQPVSGVRTMSAILDEERSDRRAQLTLVGAFAGLALLLASVGLYGVLSYEVTQRTPEIGVRMALGAGRGDMVRSVLGRALLLTAAGTALGLAGALALTRLLASALYGVEPFDPATFAAVPVVVVAVALMATVVPARRAAGVDPLRALRTD